MDIWEEEDPHLESILLNNEEDRMDEGLDKELYGRVKKMKVGKTSKMCTICCVAFQKEEVIRKLPCNHIFHNKCIKP